MKIRRYSYLSHSSLHAIQCPGLRKDVQIRKVAFQTYNDLYTPFHVITQDYCWQYPAGFECTYSSDLKVREYSRISLAPNVSTVVLVPLSRSVACYLWDHDTTQFYPVRFDDQVHIPRFDKDPLPGCSPDGKLFASWSVKDFYVRVWDVPTGQLLVKLPTSQMNRIALSPALIEHSPETNLLLFGVNPHTKYISLTSI